MGTTQKNKDIQNNYNKMQKNNQTIENNKNRWKVNIKRGKTFRSLHACEGMIVPDFLLPVQEIFYLWELVRQIVLHSEFLDFHNEGQFMNQYDDIYVLSSKGQLWIRKSTNQNQSLSVCTKVRRGI